VGSDLVIAPGGALRTAASGSQSGHVLSVGGNLTNAGTLDLSTNGNAAGARLTFTGTASASLTGSGAVMNLRTLTINKGTSFASTLTLAPALLTVQGLATAVPGFLTLTNGTLRVSGTFPSSTALFPSAGWTIGATTGLWLDNPAFVVTPQSGSPTVAGLLRVSAGTLGVGLLADESLVLASGSTTTIEGGAVNVAGRVGVNAAANSLTYTQTGGTVTAATAGNTSGSLASF